MQARLGRQTAGVLRIKQDSLERRRDIVALEIARRGSAQWQSSAGLARETYRREYGADIAPSPDAFAVLTKDLSSPDKAGSHVTAVAGMTFASAGRLLSENYLDEAAEVVLARLLGQQLERSEIVEVGSLASTSRGAGMHLLSFIPMLCWCNGAKAVLCTVTERVGGALPLLGIPFVPIGRAFEDDLPAEQRGRWGTYYASQPVTGYLDLRYCGQMPIPSLRPAEAVHAGVGA
jgi:hypothetical protein